MEEDGGIVEVAKYVNTKGVDGTVREEDGGVDSESLSSAGLVASIDGGGLRYQVC